MVASGLVQTIRCCTESWAVRNNVRVRCCVLSRKLIKVPSQDYYRERCFIDISCPQVCWWPYHTPHTPTLPLIRFYPPRAKACGVRCLKFAFDPAFVCFSHSVIPPIFVSPSMSHPPEGQTSDWIQLMMALWNACQTVSNSEGRAKIQSAPFCHFVQDACQPSPNTTVTH